MIRITLNVTPEQSAGLKSRADQTGVLQSEQIRRYINLGLFVDQQKQRPARPAQPVLITPKASE
jgi:hypothetical protein